MWGMIPLDVSRFFEKHAKARQHSANQPDRRKNGDESPYSTRPGLNSEGTPTLRSPRSLELYTSVFETRQPKASDCVVQLTSNRKINYTRDKARMGGG